MGATPSQTDFFTGVLDELALYDAAFPSERVSAHYSALGLLANDRDVDADDSVVVAAVEGQATNVGRQIDLPSGAFLQVNADGSYDYDPRQSFASLAAGAQAQ